VRFPALSTLSARIVLGFAVLILTFGVVTAVTSGNMYLLSKQIRLIPNGYLELALISKDLVEKQKSLRQYLAEELPEEPSRRRVEQRLGRLQGQRGRLMTDARARLDALRDAPTVHKKQLEHTESFLSSLEETLAQGESRYEVLMAMPPIERLTAMDPERQKELDDATAALEELRRTEANLLGLVRDFSNHQERLVEGTALGLARNERRVRVYTIYLGIVAIVIGLLITLWVTLTLRPLRRLQQAARRIAAGQYSGRIEEKGPREVADLAHEFNVMGRAIEEREREVVRNERLAAVGKMAAMITHEVRNPLSSLSLNTELLEEELASMDVDGEAQSLCRAINKEVDRLTEITEEYLKFARLPKPKLQPNSVNAVIMGLVSFQREDLLKRDVTVHTEFEDDLPEVVIDEAQLRRGLLNLVRNAAEALEEVGGGAVTLASSRIDDDTVEISVSDDGPGIPQELADKLFDPFVSTKERGTGLGLALTHQIVREHGGLMSVDSAPGQGTTFRLKLLIRGPENRTVAL
jgi:signal transduction histidine kinase